MEPEFFLCQHVSEYHQDFATVIAGLIPASTASEVADRIARVIAARANPANGPYGVGSAGVSCGDKPARGQLLNGDEVRIHLPELVFLHHALRPLIAAVTSQDVVVPAPSRSDITIATQPPFPEALWRPRKICGITALLLLSTRSPAALQLYIPRHHASSGCLVDRRAVYAAAGALILVKETECVPDAEYATGERSVIALLRYEPRGDTGQPDASGCAARDGLSPFAPTTIAVPAPPRPGDPSDYGRNPLAECA